MKKLRQKPTRAQWIKMGVVTALYLAFLVWIESWWGLLVVPFIYDAYITKRIPWTWWKEAESPVTRTVMSWVDAIVFALVAVYFVNIYFFQNYTIPSSSLEKSLLVGDYLFVSKMSYGPRKPQTPLSMPLTQHTMPLVGCKSYIEWPQWDYERVPGGRVQLNDIVVFNYPAGDTVTVNPEYQNMDFMPSHTVSVVSNICNYMAVIRFWIRSPGSNSATSLQNFMLWDVNTSTRIPKCSAE